MTKTHVGRGLATSRAAAILLATLFSLACTSIPKAALPGTGESASPGAELESASPTPTPVPTGTETLAPAATESATPTPLANVAQAPVTYTPPPPPTPWPTVAPGLWRWQGVVVDGAGNPVDGVCIAIGPHGCQPSSPRTDDRGAWFIDFPQAAVSYDLHFSKDGLTTFDVRVTPTSDWKLDVTLKQ